jgi:RHS repeat-associated protein
MGGSFARTGLPNVVTTTAYAANQLTQWGTATLTYDLNGNMLSDGVNAFVWNARNQLASMNLGADSFQYDFFGRRVSKTLSGSTTSYLYDGMNVAQELSGGVPTANLLNGLGVDEVFARTDSVGARNFLTGALGSSLALTDSTGAVQTQYTYEPFGNTSVSGSTSANPYQFTGRENDGTGLYFYRARYYDPGTGRFLSEDPTGPEEEGPNLYRYVNNNPATNADPSGLFTIDKSCKNRCQRFGGGGPNNPNQGPTLENLEEVIRRETEDWCNNLYRITDPKLRACIQKSCQKGKIKCKEKCDPDVGAYNRKFPLLTNRTATLCPNDWPDSTPASYVGGAVIHECAHGCG